MNVITSKSYRPVKPKFPVIMWDNALFNRRQYLYFADDSGAQPLAKRMADGRRYTGYSKTVDISGGEQFWDLDISFYTSIGADSLVVDGHNLGPRYTDYGLSWGRNISLAYWGGGIWNSVLSSNVSSTGPAAFTFPYAESSTWRLSLYMHNTDFYSDNEVASIANLFIGRRIDMPSPPDAPFAQYGDPYKVDHQITKGGHVVGSIVKQRPIIIKAKFSDLDRQWVKDYFDDFWDHATSFRPFWWVWNPGSHIRSNPLRLGDWEPNFMYTLGYLNQQGINPWSGYSEDARYVTLSRNAKGSRVVSRGGVVSSFEIEMEAFE